MTPYKNRPPMDPGTELRRYVPLVGLEQMLRSRQLRLTRIDQFDDPFEGSVPKRQIDDQVPIFSGANFMRMTSQQVTAHYYPEMAMPRGPYRDPWEQMTLRRRALTRSAHASCWTAGPESEGMWRLYCDDGARGQGVSVRSTLSKVEASVSVHALILSPVNYRLYHEGPPFDAHLDALMHKRLGFKHENKRLLRYDEPHYLALAFALTGGHEYGLPPVIPAALPDHIFLSWSMLDIADAITVSPYASEEYEQTVRAAVAAADASATGLIELSVLSERRYGPLF